MRRFALLIALTAAAFAAGCATKPPHSADNVCSVFAQNNGWMSNWRDAAENASARYGVPVSVLMATIYTESTFDGDAKPPRDYVFFGLIPWGRVSSAYGYSQALDGTWEGYQRATGSGWASRSDFADAVDFVGWYHRQSYERNGIALDDAYHLYLAYYAGHGGYERGVWRSKPGMTRAARRMADMNAQYAAQLRQCR